MSASLVSGWAVSHRRAQLVVLILIVLLATALRLHQLHTESLWGDEVHEARTALQDLASIVSTEPLALRLPLAHIFMLVGRQEVIFRFPYAAMGILGVAALYAVGRTVFDDATGIVGAFLLAISPFHIYYSQEARSYSLTVLFAMVSFYCLYRALQDNQLRHWAGFAIIAALSLGNHPTTASVVASEVAFAVLVLLGERCSRRNSPQNHYTRPGPRGQRRSDRLWRVRSSKWAMLAISVLLAVLLFLVFSRYWLSYLTTIDLSIGGRKSSSDRVMFHLTQSQLKELAGEFGIGPGMGLYLFGGAFVAGLGVCAIRGRWRQMLLAPIWIVPPLLVLPQTSATAPLLPRHLIFILPMYVLFIAQGVTGVCGFLGQVMGRSARSKEFVWGVSLLLVLGTVSWQSVEPVQAAYAQEKADWRGVAAFLQEQVSAGDLISQLHLWPRDAVPYYMDGGGMPKGVKILDHDYIAESHLPADVWWVLFVPPPEVRFASSSAVEALIGPGFDIYRWNVVAVVHRQTPLATRSDYWQLATRLLFAQTQSDVPRRLEGYQRYLIQVLDKIELDPVPLAECPPQFSDPRSYIEAAWEQLQDGQERQALGSVQTASLLHTLLYPGVGPIDDSLLQALYRLSDAALASEHHACALDLYSRADDAHLLAAQTVTVDAEHWRDLARALMKDAHYPEAIEAYTRLVQLVPDQWKYRVRWAQAYRANGQMSKAAAALEQAVEMAPNKARPRRELAHTYLLLERLDEAIAAYRQVLEIRPADIQAHFGLALAYDAQGMTAQAIAEFQIVIETDPEHWLAEQARQELATYEQ